MKKIPTIFKRNPERMQDILNEITPGCEWVFDGQGIPTRKYDGTSCKIDANGYWKRREVKDNKPTPDGFVLEEYDPNTCKSFGWVPVDPTNTENKYHMEAYSENLEYGLYELCGPKIQRNHEKYDSHTLVSIDNAEILPEMERTFDGIKQFLTDKDIEGIVFHHGDGRMAKIKKRDFGLKRV